MRTVLSTVTTTATTLVAAMALTSAAHAVDITWNLNAAGNWGDAGNWSPAQVPGTGDDVFFDAPFISMPNSHRAIALQTDRTINSITVDGSGTNNQFQLNGAGLTLTLESGNITMNGGDPNPNSALTINTALRVGDGVTAVTDAVWTSFRSGNRGLDIAGPVHGIAGTVVTLNAGSDPEPGNSIFSLRGDNSNFLGTFIVDSPTVTRTTIRPESATNGLGAGTFIVNTETNLAFHTGPNVGSEVADIQVNANTFVTGGSGGLDGIRTFNGVISGNGLLTLNRQEGASTGYETTIVMAGDNTHSGAINIRGGTLRVDGNWTGAGNLNFNDRVRDARLEGNGSLGLGSGSTILINGGTQFTVDRSVTVSAGTVGTVGVFTVGTDNTNTVTFNGANGAGDPLSFLHVDIDGSAADLLVILGNLNLSGTGNAIVFNELSSPSSSFYTLVTYTGTLTGEFSTVIGLPDGYTLDYSTAGQINLIPEPGSLALLGVGGMLMLMRRRD